MIVMANVRIQDRESLNLVIARFFKGLGDPIRLKMLEFLCDGERASQQNSWAVSRGNGQEVETVRAHYSWEAGPLDATLHHASLSIDQLKLRKPQKVPGMIHAFFGTLTRLSCRTH